MRSLRSTLLLLSLAALLPAQLELSPVFGDHMVLQMGKPILVWGRGRPGEDLELRISDSRARTRVRPDGGWAVEIGAPPAGGPYVLEVVGSETLRCGDVLVGEVWLCSGQSNMEWPLRRSDGAERFIANSADDQLRLLEVQHHALAGPVTDFAGEWQVCSPESVAEFSAVAYHFGAELRRVLGVPLGLVQSAWGGTPAEAWTSRGALSAEPRLLPLVIDDARASASHSLALARASFAAEKPPRSPRDQNRPAFLYNGMIAPLIPMRLRGVIWYQGESNAGRADQYRHLFPTMIRSWRSDFGQGDIPFLFVQLANWADGRGWPELREAQTQALAEPATAMAVTIDIGDEKDIHPRNKQDVGLRLALAAGAIAYANEVEYSGPVLEHWHVDGDSIVLHFKHAVGGFRVLGEELAGFEIAAADGEFLPAEAELSADSIRVRSSEVSSPSQLRYGWQANPVCNLYNRQGLPAVPFRTATMTDKQSGSR